MKIPLGSDTEDSAPQNHSATAEQAFAALLGCAVGDALGWPQEQNSRRSRQSPINTSSVGFIEWTKRVGGRFQPYEEVIRSGDYSDDTQLILATARSLGHGNRWPEVLSRQELPLWLLYERGGGRSTKRAAEAWQRRLPPWQAPEDQKRAYYMAGGNGAAMRIMPHVLVNGQTKAGLLRDIMRNAILTHGHPRALLGALVYGLAAWYILNSRPPLPFAGVIEWLSDNLTELEAQFEKPDKYSLHWLEAAQPFFDGGYRGVWQETLLEIRQGLKTCSDGLMRGAIADDLHILEQLGTFDSKQNGAGTVTTLSVVYLFSAHAADPLIGLRTIAYAPSSDTDTQASMLAGLFGISNGVEWLPMALRQVQDQAYLENVAIQLATRPEVRDSDFLADTNNVVPWWTKRDHELVLDELAKGQERKSTVELGTLGNVSIEQHRLLKTFTRNLVVHQWQLRTQAGQTLFVKRVRKDTSKPASRAVDTTESNIEAEGAGVPPQNSTVLSSRLAELANHLPVAVTGQSMLRLLAAVLHEPLPSVTTLRVLVETHADKLSPDDQKRLVELLDDYLGFEKW